MTEIQTILGPIDSNQLGVTLSHEHVLVDYSNDIYHYPWLFDMDQTEQKLVVELREAKAGGVDSIIDLSTPDLGRNIPFVKSECSFEKKIVLQVVFNQNLKAVPVRVHLEQIS